MIYSKIPAQRILDELNLGNLGATKRKQMLDKITDHFNRVVLMTMLDNLSSRDFERLKQALNSADFENEVAGMAGHIPGLAKQIEQRLDEEFKLMKAILKN